MKANPSRSWLIVLRGARPGQMVRRAHVGTIEDVFAEADVLECEVCWQVREVSIRAQAAKRRTLRKGRA